jgi:hypothetical protein
MKDILAGFVMKIYVIQDYIFDVLYVRIDPDIFIWRNYGIQPNQCSNEPIIHCHCRREQ